MTYSEIQQLSSSLQAVATVLAIAVGGCWAYLRFRRQREGFPYIEFTADVEFIRKQHGWWIVELIAYIENKGKVQHRMTNLDFDFAALFLQDAIAPAEQFNGQVFFPHELRKGSFLPRSSSYFFVEPGVKAKYSHIAQVPEHATVVILHTWFSYSNRTGHTAERTVRVPRHDKKEDAINPRFQDDAPQATRA